MQVYIYNYYKFLDFQKHVFCKKALKVEHSINWICFHPAVKS